MLINMVIQAELEYTKQMLEVAETQKRELNDVIDSLEKQVASNAAEFDAKNKKITDLQSQLYTSQQGWITERENLQQKYEYARQNMRDWEVVAMEERAVRESLGERVAELEEQANSKEDMIQRVESDKKRAMDTLAIKQAVAENLEKGKGSLWPRKMNANMIRQSFPLSRIHQVPRLRFSPECVLLSKSALKPLKKILPPSKPASRRHAPLNISSGKRTSSLESSSTRLSLLTIIFAKQ